MPLTTRLRSVSLMFACAAATFAGPGASAPKPRPKSAGRLVDHEIAEIGRIARKVGVPMQQLSHVSVVLEQADAGRQSLLAEVFQSATAMDQAWGMLWNDEAVLAKELPLTEDALSRLYDHERARLVEAATHVPPPQWLATSLWLEREAAKAKGRDLLKLVKSAEARKAIETAWASIQTVDPTLVSFCRDFHQRARDVLMPRWATWTEASKRIRPSLDSMTEWEYHREVRDQRTKLSATVDELLTALRASYATLDSTQQAGLVVSFVRNLRRLGWVLKQRLDLPELAYLE